MISNKCLGHEAQAAQDCSTLTICLAVFEHVHQARVLHLYDRLHVFGDELSFHHLDNRLFRRFIQAVHHPLNLLIDSGFHLLYVHTGTVFCEELLALHLSENNKHLQAVKDNIFLKLLSIFFAFSYIVLVIWPRYVRVLQMF